MRKPIEVIKSALSTALQEPFRQTVEDAQSELDRELERLAQQEKIVQKKRDNLMYVQNRKLEYREALNYIEELENNEK